MFSTCYLFWYLINLRCFDIRKRKVSSISSFHSFLSVLKFSKATTSRCFLEVNRNPFDSRCCYLDFATVSIKISADFNSEIEFSLLNGDIVERFSNEFLLSCKDCLLLIERVCCSKWIESKEKEDSINNTENRKFKKKKSHLLPSSKTKALLLPIQATEWNVEEEKNWQRLHTQNCCHV